MFPDRLKAYIDHARDAEQIIGILQHVPLDKVKELAKQHVESAAPETLRSMFHESVPVDLILSTDELQTVLSFVPDQTPLKSVNKLFSKIMHDNEIIAERAKERSRNRNVWLVDPDRKHLNAAEIEKSIKGPIESLSDALRMQRLESGDKILLSEGQHILEYHSLGEKDVHIEGIGECVISVGDIEPWQRALAAFNVRVGHKLSLSNIRFDDGWISFIVNPQGILCMTDCVFHANTSHIRVRSNGRVDLMRVQLTSARWDSLGAISASPNSSISARNCVFDACDGWTQPCIRLPRGAESVSLRLVGNLFTNLRTIPIGEDGATRVKVSDGAELRNNRIGHKNPDIDVLHAFMR